MTGDLGHAQRFAAMMCSIMDGNPFYRHKYDAGGFTSQHPPTLADLSELPMTTKRELVEDSAAHPPFGSNLSFPLSVYTRVHQTSGTTGRPLRWLDTPDSWEWWLRCWQVVYAAAGVKETDRVFVAFSFGPFIGFWSAFEAAERHGTLAISGGGLTSSQRIDAILDHDATVLVCTPTYALRLAEVARESGYDLGRSRIHTTINAGEPGASIPNVRDRIETAWGARCVDHIGATEIGAWGFACGHENHVHINEHEFIAEVVRSETHDQRDTEIGELVLTNLGRVGSPVVRYRTGDHVELARGSCACGHDTAYLDGGVLGRVDDMLVVRGINVFPSALEDVIRDDASIVEFQVFVHQRRGMAEMEIQIEVQASNETAVADCLRDRIHRRLGLRTDVAVVPGGSLPRYELKGRRFHAGPKHS